jgi:hypothetical protein
MTAYWHPAGVWGLMYWYAFAPAHGVVFSGTVKEICRLAEREAQDAGGSPASG